MGAVVRMGKTYKSELIECYNGDAVYQGLHSYANISALHESIYFMASATIDSLKAIIDPQKKKNDLQN